MVSRGFMGEFYKVVLKSLWGFMRFLRVFRVFRGDKNVFFRFFNLFQ